MAAIRIADLFASIGVKADVRQLNRFQKRLALVKKQLLQLKRLSRTPLSPNTNIAAVRSLNTELGRTLRLARQIQSQGPISVRRTGGAAAAGRGGGGGRRGGAGGGFFSGQGSGAAAATLGLRGGLGRNFLAGFTTVVAVKQLFQAAASLEGIEVALGAVTREGQDTGEVIAFLRAEAERLGFDFETSALEFAKLAAAGNSVNLELRTVNEVFIAAQEAARVFNLSVSDTEGVLKAFTQIISKGKITAEELRNQLGDRLPGAVGIFARALGVTTEELSKMLETGQVFADDETLQAVARELRRTVAADVEAASKSLRASFNRFRTALFEFSAGLGRSGVSSIFSSVLTGAKNLLNVLGPIIKVLVRAIQVLIAPIRAFGRVLERPIERIPKLTSLFFGLVGAVLLMRTALARMSIAWVIAFAPVLATAAGLSALVLLIEDWLVAIEGGDSIISRMAGSTNVFMAVIGGSLINLGKFVQFIGQLVGAIVTGNFDELTESMKRFFSAIDDFVFGSSRAKFTAFLEAVAGVFGETPDEIAARVLAPSRITPRASASAGVGGGGTTVVEVMVDSSELGVSINESNLRQAQADFPDNE